MTFLNITMPVDIGLVSVGGPSFSTDIVVTDSGKEQRTSNWSHPRRRWSVRYPHRGTSSFATLLAFFNIVRGKRHSFRFKDWWDFQEDRSYRITHTGSLATFQLTKRYSIQGMHMDRVLYKPVSSSVAMFRGATELQTNLYSVDNTTGVVTFTPPLSLTSTEVSARCDFDVEARLDEDTMNLSTTSTQLASWERFNVIEVL